MKLAIAAACLVASLSLATNALADGRTVATLQQPIAAKTQVVAGGAVWDCAYTSCVAANTPDESFGAGQCRELAKQVGAITDFTDESGPLQSAALVRCDANLIAKPSMTASR